MRTKRPRKWIWINGHKIPRPVTDSYKKFLEATLPVVEPYRNYNIGNIAPRENNEDR
tara:strand:+ start:407 stop:577 length:171 start_codon:yes stop_codon:yes gene_type:complete